MSNEFPGDEWDEDDFETFSGFDDSNDDGFEEFEAAAFGESDSTEPEVEAPQEPTEPVTSPTPVIKSSPAADDEEDDPPHDGDLPAGDGPRITRIENDEEVFVPTTYDDADFDDIVLSPTAFRAPMASSVLTSATAKASKGRSKQLDISKLDEKTQRKASQPRVEEQMKQQEKSAKLQEREARKREKREQLEKERIEKEQLRQKKKEEREQKQRLRRQEARKRAQEKEAEGKSAPKSGSRRKAVAGIAVVAAAAILVPTGLKLYSAAQDAVQSEETRVAMPAGAADDSEAQTSTPTSSSSTAAAPQNDFDSYVASHCREATESGETTTRANGDGSTPLEAIKGFNYAYFTLKDAQAATEFLDSSMYKSVSSLQEGINHPDNGDSYCLHVQDSDSDVYKVSVIEFVKPKSDGEKPQMWKTDQSVTVKQDGNKWVISGQEITS